jgi:hypothetical protein
MRLSGGDGEAALGFSISFRLRKDPRPGFPIALLDVRIGRIYNHFFI